jgi:DMSO reductase family type II enzyme heme b subunit
MRTIAALAAVCVLGSAGSALAKAGDVAKGAQSYEKRCSQCHGAKGDADGPGATFMLPRPRVLRDNAIYKFRTTSSGELPTDQDLFDIISRGLPGTAMPPFDVLPEAERWDLVAFIKSLTVDFKEAGGKTKALPELTGKQEPPPADAASLAKGAELWKANKCWQCHGQKGRGDGESWPSLKDSWKNQILPANLTNLDTYRGGAKPFDIYRTISTGINGTPMPAYAESIKPADRWHLVNFILSLAPKPQEKRDDKVVAVPVAKLPETDDDKAWAEAPVSRFATFSNVIEAPRLYWRSVELVMVQALYSDREIAIRVQWDDRGNSKGSNVSAKYADRDDKIYSGTDHPDQMAVQFPAGLLKDLNVRPYILFGDKQQLANLWWFRSDKKSVSELNGKGSGSLDFQDPASQELKSSSSFADGRYTVVIRRSLTTADPKIDVQFAPGGFVPIAFHLWDGDRGEVGNRRALTAWYWLYLKAPVPMQAYIAPPIAFGVTFAMLLGLAFLLRRRAGRS